MAWFFFFPAGFAFSNVSSGHFFIFVDCSQPHRATPVWEQREQVSSSLLCPRVFCISHSARWFHMVNFKSSHVTDQWLIGFSARLTGVCWRNPSESRPSWHLCRLAGPSLSSWRRSRRWSLLLKGNSWRPYGFISTSRSTKQNYGSLFYRFPWCVGVTILTVVVFPPG